ncbi:MAG TPA: beta-propeller fold lactonase family protein [Anaerolineales bacterium]|nr:beta-propeller fold lactonase family protein [Anaerolineales bacterium]
MSITGLFRQKIFKLVTTSVLVISLLITNLAVAFAASDQPGAVYVQTNQAGGNAIAVFNRSTDGALALAATVPTGGLGTGTGLGSATSVVLSNNGRWLFVVNAGSNEISAFRVEADGLTLVDKVSSGGTLPISLALYKSLLYVLNAGGSGSITGFVVDQAGSLAPLAGSTRPLSNNNIGAAPGPAQVSFSPDGKTLVVTEKATSIIDTYVVGKDGLASGPTTNPSAGITPFGFAFTQQGALVVSEAFGGAPLASAVSSYDVADGQLNAISASVPTGQTAACWIAVSKNGKFAYSTNAGSGSVSAYRVGTDGSLSLIDGAAGITGDGTSPVDAAVSNNGQYLYVLNGRTHNISAFAIQSDGSLASLGTFEGVPAGSAGITSW